MNQQIQELIKQAGTDCSGKWMGMNHAEKFAELIVEECMACATWVGKINNNPIEPQHTAEAINQRIRKHFGVEE